MGIGSHSFGWLDSPTHGSVDDSHCCVHISIEFDLSLGVVRISLCGESSLNKISNQMMTEALTSKRTSIRLIIDLCAKRRMP